MTLGELEKLRKKTCNYEIMLIVLIIVQLLLFLYFFYTDMILKFIVLFLIFIPIFVFGIILFTQNRRKFILEFKTLFVAKALKSIFTDLRYEPESGIPKHVIAKTNMMYMGDRYTSNDFVAGKYKNVNFVQSDIHIEEERTTTNNDGHTTTTWETIFMGKWIIFDYNKSFKTNIEVSQKGFSNSKVNNLFLRKTYKKVEMEDEEFNKMFNTYAQNEHEAFYILTPSLMDRIKNINKKLNGTLLFCFINNKLHIGIQNNKDSFEPRIFKPIDGKEIINKLTAEIKVITDFADELNLDNNLFRKEV